MYDYVIVGAGSAGCVLAARLSEDPDVRVALLEAGGQDTRPGDRDADRLPDAAQVERRLGSLRRAGAGARRPAAVPARAARCVGGSGSINAMIYLRGNRADYDGWAAGGADGLELRRGAAVLQALGGQRARRGRATTASAGPLSVSDSRAMSPLIETMLEASELAGLDYNPDFNGARQDGVGRFQITQRNGRRHSTAAAFLHPAEARPNLDVITDALALRILFDGRARGGRRGRARRRGRGDPRRARGDPLGRRLPVAGAADALGHRAGGGSRAASGSTVRENLPVGHDLQDHCMAQLNYETDEPSLFGDVHARELRAVRERGPRAADLRTSPRPAAFFRTRPGLEAPDMQFHYAPSMFYDEGLTAPHDSGYCFGPVVIKPSSRGRVMLRAPLADSKPRVLCNFLTTEEDRAVHDRGHAEGARDRRAGAAHARSCAAPYSVPAGDSDEEIMDFVRRAAQTVYHPTSTCAIGSVVDPQLRVYGVEGLRVADASVMPTITRGNTNAATIMIGEKAAAIIRGDVA